ncbi:MAG: MBL fold metallo-hydrolase [Candidatus Helarchaeota archaeon]
MNLKISVIYDNTALNGFRKGWGFSSYLEVELPDKNLNILFDTGAGDEILFYNMRRLQINPEKIDKIIISHPHFDHSGGLPYILGLNDDIEVYIPEFLHQNQKSEFFMFGSEKTKFIEVNGVVDICKNIKSVCTRKLFEQFLLIYLKDGILIMTGCAHPGLASIIDYVKNIGNVYGVIGGFHAFKDLEKLNDMKFIGPCHCTSQIDRIKKQFSNTTYKVSAGSQFLFELE